MSFTAKLDRLLSRHKTVQDSLAEAASLDADSYQKLSREYAELEPIAAAITEYRKAEQELVDAVSTPKGWVSEIPRTIHYDDVKPMGPTK